MFIALAPGVSNSNLLEFCILHIKGKEATFILKNILYLYLNSFKGLFLAKCSIKIPTFQYRQIFIHILDFWKAVLWIAFSPTVSFHPLFNYTFLTHSKTFIRLTMILHNLQLYCTIYNDIAQFTLILHNLQWFWTIYNVSAQFYMLLCKLNFPSQLKIDYLK